MGRFWVLVCFSQKTILEILGRVDCCNGSDATGERFTPWNIIGGIMVIPGVLFVHNSQRKNKTDHPYDSQG